MNIGFTNMTRKTQIKMRALLPTAALLATCLGVVVILETLPTPGAAAQDSEQELSELLDRLTTRFGRERVLRFVHLDTYEPERESPAVPAADTVSANPTPWPAPEPGPLRAASGAPGPRSA